MDAIAVIPVKSLESAKSRLGLGPAARAGVCAAMLEEVLGAVMSSSVSSAVVVTRDARAAAIASAAGAQAIDDPLESGVNDAVALADGVASGHAMSLVVPQDIPLVSARDIDAILHLAPRRGSLVVPSSRLDGTNALVRTPPCAHATHYDEDSHRIHVTAARRAGLRSTVALVRGIMLDVDTRADLDHVAAQPDKPDLGARVRAALAAGD
ncbi:MAG: 2-phospho-L-lactate guanylyltransferase [Thaumarchaeota archaeon S15]|nr:MAG: 2-phospho-L-lactate guanylyltransferase [Thaumarchaeota archaeon S15]